MAAAMGTLLALVPIRLAASGALSVQVRAAAAGAVSAALGVGLGRVGWTRRRGSEIARLLVATGFFTVCLGIIGLVAGIGLYH